MGLERSIADLLEVLKMEVRSFTAITELLILEEKCLITCDNKALADVIERQGDVLTSISCLDKSRGDLLVRIAMELGAAGTEPTLTELASKVCDPLKKELLETGAVLGAVYEDMKRKKVSNTLLIRQGIMMVENDIRILLSAIGRGMDTPAGYTSGGGSTGLTGGIRIDGRI